MSEPTALDWRTLYATAVADGESGQLGTSIEDAEEAIQERLRKVGESFSAFEESELYSALRMLRRLKVQLLTAA